MFEEVGEIKKTTKPLLEKKIDKDVEVNTIYERRMYCIALKQLSTIQKGVQSAHAIVEYGLKYHNSKIYEEWANGDKTIVILNGKNVEDLNNIIETLDRYNVLYGTFKEESLGNITTAVCFITDNRVFYDDYVEIWDNEEIYALRDIIKKRHLAK